MKNSKAILAILLVSCLLMMVVVSCSKLDTVTPQQTQTIASGMNLHLWLSGFDKTSFGIKAQQRLSPVEYKQVLTELNIMIKGSGFDEYYYNFFVNNGSDEWFDLGNDASYPNGDLYTPRTMVQEYIKNGGIQKARHMINSYITNVGTKTIRIHQNVPASWKTAITDAAKAWNGLGYGIKFAISYTSSVNDWYYSSGEIDVSYQSTAPNNLAFSSLTYAATKRVDINNGIGESLHINSNYSTTSASCKKMVITHELGHCIGLSHTDASDLFTVAVNVSGCGKGTTDYTSIMNKGDWMYDNIPWQGFTTCDKKVIAAYWPKWFV